jgi:hypothetical protein
VDLDAVTLRLRFPKFLFRAKELFGAEVKPKSTHRHTIPFVCSY